MNLYQKPRVEMSKAPVTALSEGLERLKQEHGELKQVLLEMEKQAKQVESAPEHMGAMQSLLNLRLWALAFREELERHSNWEELELFPFLTSYIERKMSPSLLPSFWSLEKDHELADEHMQAFLRSVHLLKANPEAMSFKQAAAYLVQACHILQDHLAKEEQLVFPLTQQVLDDINYSLPSH
ncbi:Hemerythrin HHE cation binding domain-containing protein [Paenibacillus sp. 1_12]|uniref:hemerythrin domain-containing protein n=1 Tax=Paenibacillus sp. 1_12 TaxID=1566278 RepID=UPI0008DECCEA|nr:hemerythrin domain-containing protein [Paenibacillus sp. 1_12]SFK77811.1 Hemerythrin HHE cation binding domain-containing protein [Paenibacillus sp. 1_12]